MEILPLTKKHKMPQDAECTYISFTYAEMFEQFHYYHLFDWGSFYIFMLILKQVPQSDL